MLGPITAVRRRTGRQRAAAARLERVQLVGGQAEHLRGLLVEEVDLPLAAEVLHRRCKTVRDLLWRSGTRAETLVASGRAGMLHCAWCTHPALQKTTSSVLQAGSTSGRPDACGRAHLHGDVEHVAALHAGRGGARADLDPAAGAVLLDLRACWLMHRTALETVMHALSSSADALRR
jgi:hypothetical protein